MNVDIFICYFVWICKALNLLIYRMCSFIFNHIIMCVVLDWAKLPISSLMSIWTWSRYVQELHTYIYSTTRWVIVTLLYIHNIHATVSYCITWVDNTVSKYVLCFKIIRPINHFVFIEIKTFYSVSGNGNGSDVMVFTFPLTKSIGMIH